MTATQTADLAPYTGKGSWNPATHPYRVSHIQNAAKPVYWRDHNVCYATEAEARAAFEAPSAIKGLRCVDLHFAGNAETWSKNGYWKPLAHRKPYRKAKVVAP